MYMYICTICPVGLFGRVLDRKSNCQRLRRRYKAKYPNQPKIVIISCSKTRKDIEME